MLNCVCFHKDEGRRFADAPGRKRGFTLIELLVVIAIIALLAAILFPVFARAREAAKKASCQSNMKQIGLAIAQYQNDNDGYFPIGFSDNDWTPGNSTSWPVAVQSYIKNLQVFYCPDDSWAGRPMGGGGFAGVMISYVGNGVSGWSWNGYPQKGPMGNHESWMGPSRSPSLTDSQLAHPSQSILVAEQHSDQTTFTNSGITSPTNPNGGVGIASDWSPGNIVLGPQGEGYGGWGGTSQCTPDFQAAGPGMAWTGCGTQPITDNRSHYGADWDGGISNGHNGLSNFLFCDGHVKALNPIVTAPQGWVDNDSSMWDAVDQ